ncbi:tetratricopeptide repeat protein [Polaribacter sp. MSW13]|uniref:histidine kinase n=1 Tax=Polaribacter marinus TaxID=2916838 RepID=A0A9X1VQ47_9FLAO|nr:tetratricopeptide repeat protein [Polaribacter marinus]MCI2229057.1 tetratricopeptide repeat protein [Polaribacter marinus]
MKFKILFISTNLLFCFNLYSAINKEAVNKTASLFVIQDSTIYKKLFFLKQKSEQDSILKTLEIGLKLADESLIEGKVDVSIEANSIIAEAYTKSGNYKKAISYYRKVLKLIQEYELVDNALENSGIDLIKNKVTLQLGSTYQNLSLKEKSIIYKDSSLYFYNKIIYNKSITNNVELLRLKAKAYSNLSGIFSADKKYELAESYANSAIKIHRKQNNKLSEAAAMSNLANVYIYLEDYKRAKEIYKEALSLIEHDKSNLATKFKEALYENIAYSMYKLKDYKAYEVQTISYDLKDSLRDKEVRGMIEKLAFQYDYNKGKALGKKEEENKRLKDQRAFWIFGIGSFMVVLSLLYWLNIFKLKQKNLKLKLSQSELIQNQNIEKIKSDSQVRILNATIDGKETERKQIAETLHDSVSALLSSANLHLQATRKQFNGETPIEIDKTQQIITEASQKIRDLSHTLVSSVLLKFGLNYAIKDMAEKYSNSQIKIETEITDIRRYHQNFEIKVYNIIQEFVNNILKHSNAKNATITLSEEEHKLSFVIVDDGVGFDKSKIRNKDGLGINQIEARIQMMKGKLSIKSSKNKGTRIEVELPILEKELFNHA